LPIIDVEELERGTGNRLTGMRPVDFPRIDVCVIKITEVFVTWGEGVDSRVGGNCTQSNHQHDRYEYDFLHFQFVLSDGLWPR
jgi:hypothetical protein